MSQATEHLLSKSEALSSNTKKKKKGYIPWLIPGIKDLFDIKSINESISYQQSKEKSEKVFDINATFIHD
jgi:hypothetical protein